MTRYIKKLSKKTGMMPGSVVYVGVDRPDPTRIDVIDFSAEQMTEVHDISVEECRPYRESKNMTWINVIGVHNTDMIKKMGELFDIPALALEDITNTGQRPKSEELNDAIFFVMKMLYLDKEHNRIRSEQVSVVFSENLVVSFQEVAGDVFQPVRDRLAKTIPRVRTLYSDYLAYSLIDAVVDHYYVILETVGEQIEALEEELIANATREHLGRLHDLKRELLLMRRATWPLREVLGFVERTESDHIHEQFRPYWRDLYEHVIQVIDNVETFRDMASGLLDLYMTSISNRMNEVMKVLTVIATIFIPLGFLAGVYGMNFDPEAGPLNMPELHLPFGYLMFWGLVVVLGGGMVLYFRRKKWF